MLGPHVAACAELRFYDFNPASLDEDEEFGPAECTIRIKLREEEERERDLLDIMMDCQNEEGAMLTREELCNQTKTYEKRREREKKEGKEEEKEGEEEEEKKREKKKKKREKKKRKKEEEKEEEKEEKEE